MLVNMKIKYEKEPKNRKVCIHVFTIIMLSISILFGLLTIQNEAVNETNQANSSNNTKQTSSNNTTNRTTSNNTSTTTTNTTTKNTTATNASNKTNSTNTSNTTVTTKSSNANLSNLGIRPHDFSGFKATTTSYKVAVPESTQTIEVYAKAQDSKAKVTGTGKKTLTNGDNKVDVVVTAEDGTEKTYTINIVRGEQEEYTENSGNGLLALRIGNLDLLPEFNTNVYEYTAKYIGEDTKLEIEAKPTDEDYSVEITGNENLQEGENTITILVSEKNGNNVATYQITLNKSLVDEEAIAREEAEKKAKEQKTMIGIVAAVVILIAIVLFIIIKHRKNQSIAEDFSGVSLYGKNNYDEEEKEELPKSLMKDKIEETSDNQEEKVEETSDNQEEKVEEDSKVQEVRENTDKLKEDNNDKSSKEEGKDYKAESEYEEEIEHMPKEKLKEKFLDNYSNYEEEYEATEENKRKKKKEKHKGKRFKE